MHIEIYDLRTGRRRPLPATSRVNNLTWSSDSKSICYDTSSGPRSLRKVRVSDGHVEVLVGPDQFPPASGDWSGLAPDGSPLITRSFVTTEIYAFKLGRR
jgi:hypothetical protein